MDTTKAITHLSLCSGYEGIVLGLRRVLPNLREIAYVEREGFCVANLVAKMEAGELDAAPVFTDVKTFPYRKFRGCVDICSFGFPCQPFSAAGKRQATEDPRHLFPYIADGIRECQPRIVFGENVQGILSCKTGDGEPVLQYVLRTLEEMDYRATAGIFSAEEVGAPHQRKRVFITGYSKHMREPQPQGGEQDKRGRTQHPSEELGNASDFRPREHSSDSRETGTDQSGEERGVYESQGASSLSRHGSQPQGIAELAHYSGERAEAGISGQNERQEGQSEEPDYCSYRWPARPGGPQYEWEEPRVTGQTESQLGRTFNGSTCGVDATANRVDRLRLLGNGVVNQTAAKAFVTLINRLI